MSVSRLLAIVALVLLSVSGHALARQFANPAAYPAAAPWNAYVPYAGAPQPYAVPRNAYNPYARAPAPYYPANRQPVQGMPLPGYRPPLHAPPAQPPAATVVKASPARAPAGKAAAAGKRKQRSAGSDAATDSTDLGENKQAFIEALLPHIDKENRRLTKLRSEAIDLLARLDRGEGSEPEKLRLQKLAEQYRVDGDPASSRTARIELLRKIDIIPSSLALAQAANESAWGKSRFAQEANNLFGIWTYDKARGLKPKKREQGKTHLVRIFDDYGDSVRYYMHTLNSHPAYAALRDIRGQLRDSRQVIDGHELASGLEKYSAEGEKYIEIIQRLIRQHEWATLDSDNQQA